MLKQGMKEKENSSVLDKILVKELKSFQLKFLSYLFVFKCICKMTG